MQYFGKKKTRIKENPIKFFSIYSWYISLLSVFGAYVVVVVVVFIYIHTFAQYNAEFVSLKKFRLSSKNFSWFSIRIYTSVVKFCIYSPCFSMGTSKTTVPLEQRYRKNVIKTKCVPVFFISRKHFKAVQYYLHGPSYSHFKLFSSSEVLASLERESRNPLIYSSVRCVKQ